MKELARVAFPASLLGETKNVVCLSCGTSQKMIYPFKNEKSVAYNLFMQCRKCRVWFQINIEAGEQKPVDCTTTE